MSRVGHGSRAIRTLEKEWAGVSQLGGSVGLSDRRTIGGGVNSAVFAVEYLGRRHYCARDGGCEKKGSGDGRMRFKPLEAIGPPVR